MLSADQALRLSLLGDPERMLIRANAVISEAAKNKNTSCVLKFSKHLYGHSDVRVLIGALGKKGYCCLVYSSPAEQSNHEIEVRW